MNPGPPAPAGGAQRMLGSMAVHTIQFAVARGVPWDVITAETGLRRADLLAPDPWVPAGVVPTVWRLIEARCPGEAPALDLARSAPASFFGDMAHNLRFAADLRRILEAVIGFRAVLSDGLDITLREGADEAALEVSHPADALDGGHGAEVGIGLWWRLLREAVDPSALRRVHFAHAPHGPEAKYVDVFGVPVRFGQPRHALIFASDALDRPLAERDPALFAYVREHLALMGDRLEALNAADGLAAVRAAIAHNAERADYSAEGLARRMGMSLRSLQRLATEHDTTVSALLAAARTANAQALLTDPRPSIDEVAETVGYADRRAFSRAFKRWTGQTPAAYRRSA